MLLLCWTTIIIARNLFLRASSVTLTVFNEWYRANTSKKLRADFDGRINPQNVSPYVDRFLVIVERAECLVGTVEIELRDYFIRSVH